MLLPLLPRKKTTQLALVLILSTLVLPAWVCNKESAYQKVALASKTFADAMGHAQNLEIKLHNSGQISADEHIFVQKIFLETAQDGLRLNQAIRAAHSESDVYGAFNATVEDINKLLNEGVLHIKNPQAQDDVRAGVIAAETALAVIQSVFSKAGQAQTTPVPARAQPAASSPSGGGI